MKNNPTYLSSLTFPRFVLSILVVIVHFGLHLAIFQGERVSNILQFMGVAISFFFFLSGFVLAYNYDNKTNVKLFWVKRFARIYPSYILSFVSVFILLLITDRPIPTLSNSILNALGLQSWNAGYALELNFPSWSLSVEFFFYLIFPVLTFFFYKMSWKKASLAALIIWILGLLQHIYFMDNLYDPDRFFVEQFILYFPLFHLSTFIAGFAAGKGIHRKLNAKNNKASISWMPFLIATIGIFSFIYLLSFENPARFYGHNGALVPIFLLITYGLSLDTKIYPKLIGTKPMIYLGELSYGIYIWQFAIYLVFTLLFGTTLFSLSEFFIYLISLILFSALMYRFFEKPSHSFIVKAFRKKQQ